MDQLPAQVFVAALADPEQLRLAAGRELTGNQAEPRGEIAPALEALSLAGGGDKGGCDDRADAWDCHQPASLFVLLHPADELGIEGCDPSIDLGPLSGWKLWGTRPLRSIFRHAPATLPVLRRRSYQHSQHPRRENVYKADTGKKADDEADCEFGHWAPRDLNSFESR